VDWTSEPSMSLARTYAKLSMPVYDDRRKEGDARPAKSRTPFDRADARVDVRGWITGEDGMRLYPLCGTWGSDWGAIGGVGMRLYYYALRSLCVLFFVCGALSIPSMRSYAVGKMFDDSAAARYKDATAVELTLGNVEAAEGEIDSGLASKLWIASITNAGVAMCVVGFTLLVGKSMNQITVKTDAETITMSDYTVRIRPKLGICGGQGWSSYRGKGHTRNRMQNKLIKDIERELEEKVPPSIDMGQLVQIAEIAGKPAVWVAWDESPVIAHWTAKRAQIYELEVRSPSNNARDSQGFAICAR
jgi:hypothetical protein